MALPAEVLARGVQLLEGLPIGAAANDVGVAVGEGVAGTAFLAAALAAQSLSVYWGQVQALGADAFAEQDANANAIARAAALARPGAGGNGKEPPDCDRGKRHRHHSDPKFMGGDPKQPLTDLAEQDHIRLHNDLNKFLEGIKDANGNSMRPSSSNPGASIRGNFTRAERLDALRDFYRGPGSGYADAASDFFRQHPGL